MNIKLACLRRYYLVAGLLLVGSLGQAMGAEINIMRTNFVERAITNLIEVRMPLNTFINEYRTNWLEHRRTNQVDVFATNRVVIEAVRTNLVKAYQTNWAMLTATNDVRVQAFRTNVVTAYQTNWKTLHVTNEVAMDRFETNFVNQYRTNSRTMFLTNWETVLVMKTNWIFQPVTNVVQIDLLTNHMVAAEAAASKTAAESGTSRSTSPFSPVPSTLSSDLTIEARTTGRTATNNIEVQLRGTWSSDPGAVVQVQRWRIEREDGAILSFGQEAVFKRMLPAGKYKVELRAQKELSGPVFAARGMLVLSAREALLQPQLARQ